MSEISTSGGGFFRCLLHDHGVPVLVLNSLVTLGDEEKRKLLAGQFIDLHGEAPALDGHS